MNTFIKDYTNIVKEEMQFYKNHWKTLVLINVALVGGMLVFTYKDTINGEIKKRTKKISKTFSKK